ncbi:hypothetical protein [uncultured Draconibacterium sp.]|uniref:hypothetical protein n=1 Tax=uncultured Draconibacterium sp. TaxID=1573823 RepID=UPI0025FCD05A|nr:hypothetical protein [uncultured Draconibacterium sp.]
MDFTQDNQLDSIQSDPIMGGGFTNFRFAFKSWLSHIPDVDSDNKAKISDSFLFNAGKSWQSLYVTSDQNDLSEEGNDLRDHDGHTSNLKVYVPGSKMTVRQLINDHGREEWFILFDEITTGITWCFGWKGMPATLQAQFASGMAAGDRKGYTLNYKTEWAGLIPQYVGSGAFLKEVLVLADATSYDLSQGAKFVIPENTAATTLAGFTNAIPGTRVVLVGGSTVNLTTIEATNVKFNLTADWTSEEGAELELFIRGADDYVELSRTAAA